MFRSKKLAIGLVLALLVALMTITVVLAGPNACDTRVNDNFNKLLECVTLEGVREHQAALQAIADANNNTRYSGSSGYNASKDYVVARMTEYGYNVSVQEFQFQTFVLLAPPLLEQVAPVPGPIVNNIMEYSGSGDVTAPVTVLTAPPADSTPGCEAADFAGFPAGHIALIRRGACTFASSSSKSLEVSFISKRLAYYLFDGSLVLGDRVRQARRKWPDPLTSGPIVNKDIPFHEKEGSRKGVGP